MRRNEEKHKVKRKRLQTIKNYRNLLIEDFLTPTQTTQRIVAERRQQRAALEDGNNQLYSLHPCLGMDFFNFLPPVEKILRIMK